MGFVTDFKFAFRSLARVKGLAITVILTLALGIGANAAIFSVVRGVLLRPLVNRDEDRLIYIRQSAPGSAPTTPTSRFPRSATCKRGVKTLTAFGDFSTIEFTMVGLGEPRVVRAGVVGGSYFEVMGLRPVRGRLIDATDDGPQGRGRRGADLSVLDDRVQQRSERARQDRPPRRPLRDHHRRARAVGSVPGGNRDHRERRHEPAPSVCDDGGRPRASDDGAVRPVGAGRRSRGGAGRAPRRSRSDGQARTPRRIRAEADFRIDAVQLRDQITSPARTVLLVLLAASALVFIIACSNVANLILARSVRREGELAVRAALGASTGALRRTLLAESLLLCGAGAILGVLIARPMVAVLARYAARFSVRALDVTVDATLLWVGVVLADGRRRAAGVRAAAAVVGFGERPRPRRAAACGSRPARTGGCACSPSRRSPRRSSCSPAPGMLLTTLFALQRRQTGFETRNVLALNVPLVSYERTPGEIAAFYKEVIRRISRAARRRARRRRHARAVARRRHVRSAASSSRPRATRRRTARRIRARGSAPCRRDSLRRSACRSSPAATSTPATPRRREGRDRQPEPGAADVSQRRTRSTAA